MSLLNFNTIDDFKRYLDVQINENKKQLEITSKKAGEKLRIKEKELRDDKEFLSIKEKLENKTDEKKKKKSKKQISVNWLSYDSISIYNGMGVKGELEIYFKEIENLKSIIEKLQSTKQSLENLISKGLKNNLNCLVFENDDKFELVLLQTAKEARKKFSFKGDFRVSARIEEPLFSGGVARWV